MHVISHNAGERALTPHGEIGRAVRLVECASELSEGIFIAKEIAKMTGGLDMLGKGREEKLRSFGEIAVARAHTSAVKRHRALSASRRYPLRFLCKDGFFRGARSERHARVLRFSVIPE